MSKKKTQQRRRPKGESAVGNDTKVDVVQFWLTVKTMILKLQGARQSALEDAIQQLVADPALAKGDPSGGPAWKTKLDAAVKPLDDQLAPLTGVLSTTEDLIRYLFVKFEEQIETAIKYVKQGAKNQAQGQEHELEQFWASLESNKPPKGGKRPA